MRQSVRISAGVIAAVIFCDLAIGIFVTPHRWVYPPRPVSEDGPGNPFRPYKQFFEGISTARINDSGARYTTEFVPGAPTVVVMGDSHVLARNVSDGEVMGAVAAELAVRSGHRLNVRELGRSGASAVELAVAAPQVLQRWHPLRTFIVLSSHSFDPAVLGAYQKLIAEDGTVSPPAERANSTTRRLYWRFRTSSPLAEEFCNNPINLFRMLWSQSSPNPDTDSTPADLTPIIDPTPPLKSAITALRKGFGEGLVIVYHPVLGVTGGIDPDRSELALRALCAQAGVPFISVRSRMVSDRDVHRRISNGFTNRVPGTGHLNANGHRIVGTAIWEFLEHEGLG